MWQKFFRMGFGLGAALLAPSNSLLADGFVGSPYADVYYNPDDGTLTLDTDFSSPLASLLVQGPPAISIANPIVTEDYTINFAASAYFNGSQQWVGFSRSDHGTPNIRSGIRGRYVMATYPTGLTPDAFGVVEYGVTREAVIYFDEVSFDSAPYTRPPTLADSVYPQTQKFLGSSVAHGQNFGGIVDISGSRAVFGVPLDNHSAGAIYVYDQAADGAWVESAKLTSSAAGARLGANVSLHGSTIVAGSSNDTITIFENTPNSWIESATIDSIGPIVESGFGRIIAFDGTTLVTGSALDSTAGQRVETANVFQRNNHDAWAQVAQFTADDPLSEDDNYSQAMAVEGNLIAVAAPGRTVNLPTGSVYLYEQTDIGQWESLTQIVAPPGARGFGRYIDLDAETLVVGSFDTNLARQFHVFRKDAADNWSVVDSLLAADISDVASFSGEVAIEDGTIVVGAIFDDTIAPEAGAALVFDETGTNSWELVGSLFANDAAPGDNLGGGIAIDNGRILVGAEEATFDLDTTGAAYLFEKAIPGDANLDDQVSAADLELLSANLFSAQANFQLGDFNQDHVIDGGDFNLWLRYRNTRARTVPARGAPEPNSSVILTLLAAAMFVPQRRSRLRIELA